MKFPSEDESKSLKCISDFADTYFKVNKTGEITSSASEKAHNYKEVKPFHCGLCDKSFLHEHIYKGHLILHDNGLGPRNLFKCHFCNQKFKGKGSLSQHVKHRHDPKLQNKLDCIFCTRTFKTNRDIDLHLLSHIQERPHFCHVKSCSHEFISKKTLRCHLQTHDSIRARDFRCNLCSSKFFTKSELKRHGLTHSKKKRFKCSTCGNRFGEASKLKIHRMRVHSEGRPFKCDSDGCTKAFKIKGDLKIHMIVHTGEKNHSCEICSKKFGKRSDLNSHIRSHMKERCFNCHFCEQSFTCQSSQCRHEKVQHGRGRETSG